MIWCFIAGLIIGEIVGVVITAFMVAAHNSDRYDE